MSRNVKFFECVLIDDFLFKKVRKRTLCSKGFASYFGDNKTIVTSIPQNLVTDWYLFLF